GMDCWGGEGEGIVRYRQYAEVRLSQGIVIGQRQVHCRGPARRLSRAREDSHRPSGPRKPAGESAAGSAKAHNDDGGQWARGTTAPAAVGGFATLALSGLRCPRAFTCV